MTHCCGHIDADTNVSRFARAGNICCGHKFCVRDTKNVSDFVQKHFVSATNVSQFARPKFGCMMFPCFHLNCEIIIVIVFFCFVYRLHCSQVQVTFTTINAIRNKIALYMALQRSFPSRFRMAKRNVKI